MARNGMVEPASDSPVLTRASHTVGPLGVWDSIYEGMACEVRVIEPGRERAVAEIRRHPNAYSDALLFAAAPDLLSALVELHLKAVIGTDAERHSALDAAWRAIAKATAPSPTPHTRPDDQSTEECNGSE